MPLPPATLPPELPTDLSPDLSPELLHRGTLPAVDGAQEVAHEAPAAQPTAMHMPDLGALAYTLCPTPAEFLSMCEEPFASVARRRIGEARIPAAVQATLVDYPDTVNFLAVVGVGLPDSAVLLPLWMRMANAMPRAELRVVDERALPMLERLLGDEDDVEIESIELPTLLIFDEEWHYQGRWGPRPAAAETMLDAWLAQHPEYEALAEMDEAESTAVNVDPGAWASLTEALTLQMRMWYNSGLDADASAEILALLVSLQEPQPETEAEA